MTNYRITGRIVHRLKRLVPLMILMVAACDDPFGPALWDATPDTIQIFSASRPEYIGLVSVVDIAGQTVLPLPIESPGLTGNWDFALTDVEGGLAITPASAFAGLESRARIGVLKNRTMESVTQAPRDTTEFSAEPALLEDGHVYVVRSRRAGCSGRGTGYFYAKLTAVEIDVPAGRYRFEIVRNPFCDNRSFVPPEE